MPPSRLVLNGVRRGLSAVVRFGFCKRLEHFKFTFLFVAFSGRPLVMLKFRAIFSDGLSGMAT